MPELDKRDLIALGALPTRLITRCRKYHAHRVDVQIKVSLQLMHGDGCSLLLMLHKALIVRSQKSLNNLKIIGCRHWLGGKSPTG
jgi:hypothetical protein